MNWLRSCWLLSLFEFFHILLLGVFFSRCVGGVDNKKFSVLVKNLVSGPKKIVSYGTDLRESLTNRSQISKKCLTHSVGFEHKISHQTVFQEIRRSAPLGIVFEPWDYARIKSTQRVQIKKESLKLLPEKKIAISQRVLRPTLQLPNLQRSWSLRTSLGLFTESLIASSLAIIA